LGFLAAIIAVVTFVIVTHELSDKPYKPHIMFMTSLTPNTVVDVVGGGFAAAVPVDGCCCC
jgi:hypothetical protein